MSGSTEARQATQATQATQHGVQQSEAHRPRLGTARQGHQGHGSKAGHEAKRSVKHKTP